MPYVFAVVLGLGAIFASCGAGERRTTSFGSVEVAPCHVGGCSGELCSETPDLASVCLWKAEYACYRTATATCEAQADGSCAWTPTPELTACLANPPPP